ncbi:MAG: hypothetical protein JO180_08380 [Gemmatirosa sp.]|nr:hypothetical protein [Gemmatirosa sp.]
MTPAEESTEAPGTGQQELLIAVLQLIGSIAGIATVLGGLAFLVGLLVVTQHDEMLGIVSTTSTSTYIRHGALFLPRAASASLLWMLSAARNEEVLSRVRAGIPVVGCVAVVVWAIRSIRGFDVPATRSRPFAASTGFIVLRGALNCLVILLVVRSLEAYLAPLDQVNSRLLTSSRSASRDTLERRTSLREPTAGGLGKSPSDSVYAILHSPDPQQVATSEFAWRFVFALGALLLLGLLARLAPRRKSRSPRRVELTLFSGISAESPDLHSSIGYWDSMVLRPLAYLLVTLLVVNLPAVYGVLMLPFDLPCVSLPDQSKANSRDAQEYITVGRVQAYPEGRLVGDIAGDEKSLVIWRGIDATKTRPKGYLLQFVPRDSVKWLLLTSCATGSIRKSIIPPADTVP